MQCTLPCGIDTNHFRNACLCFICEILWTALMGRTFACAVRSQYHSDTAYPHMQEKRNKHIHSPNRFITLCVLKQKGNFFAVHLFSHECCPLTHLFFLLLCHCHSIVCATRPHFLFCLLYCTPCHFIQICCFIVFSKHFPIFV